jgi:nucleoside-diphosphate-sugar epimerase
MRALVTGGGGFIGRYIVEKLVRRKDRVRVLGRRNYPELLKSGVEIIQGDIRHKPTVEAACQGMDCVFHVAALTGIWGPWDEFYQINVAGTQNVISACQKQGVSSLVYTSSPSVVYDQHDQINLDETTPYPANYLCPYPETKAIAERMVLQANGQGKLKTTALRPHLVWGPGDTNLIPRLLDRARKGKLMMVGDGTNRVDLTYVENVADAHLLAADRLAVASSSVLDVPDVSGVDGVTGVAGVAGTTDVDGVAGEAFFICQGEPVLLWQWINQFLERMGIPGIRKSISLTAAKRIGWAMETCYRIFHLKGEPVMTRFLASQLGTSHYFDILKAKKRLLYVPSISMEEGLDRLVEFYSR